MPRRDTGASFCHPSRDLTGLPTAGNLERAIARRDAIGQAKGILMRRYDVDADESFDRLRCASQTTNTSLCDIATWLDACRTP